jgi:hypothetical protein
MYGGSRDQLRPMTEEAARRCVQGLLVMPLFAWRDRFRLDAQSGRAFAFSRGVLHGGEGQKSARTGLVHRGNGALHRALHSGHRQTA